jgi:osmotically inducible protein OsmC
MKRTASAHWNGDINAGKGELSTQSTTLNEAQYSFKSRFADGVGTNPEELIGAAHAGCFTMAVSVALTQAGYKPGDLSTKATVDFDARVPEIIGIALDLTASPISGLSADQFRVFANGAKENCPVSKALRAVPITLNISY